MGSTTSKPETKVFTPETPIEFSSSFLAQLEQSPESDYSRAQYAEKYIQERVAKELTKLEREAMDKFRATTNEALSRASSSPTNSTPEISVQATNEKIAKLTQLLKENAELEKVDISPEIKESRENVINCLKSNQGKSLNCWDQVETFNKLVREL
ncbi:hypothetical protein KGF56_001830 [Candida oxycetoniae]|uniref:MICOS complex subunit MIC19 n=1 Tax=Candida oxycetoniae TaxID=497107 RepID=A0AAI9SY94_9ASCO|nr:uncharacterized protein KGF56_001830 [Candida oxycetoniae]KAI3405383.1 hypothetical protein KGF56_001830 [Candida oxycetoniae]